MEYCLTFDKKEQWLKLPFEYKAPEVSLALEDSSGRSIELSLNLAVSRIDLWMAYPLSEMEPGELKLQGPNETWMRAAYITDDADEQKRRVLSRPVIHFMPPTGGIEKINGIRKENETWILDYMAVPLNLQNVGNSVRQSIASKDFLHWKYVTNFEQSVSKESADNWIGDVEEQILIQDNNESYVLAKSVGMRIDNLPAASVFSIPACIQGKTVSAPQLNNLRVWERKWSCEKIEKEFYFKMRFRQGPDVWPEIHILEADNTLRDIKTEACEVWIELLVGQELEIKIDLCGMEWVWQALDQTMRCGEYIQKVPVRDGKLSLHFYRDLVCQELFSKGEKAMFILQKEGPLKADYKIKSDLVENINNDSFFISYIADPYIRIKTPGNTAHIMEMKVWGLRSVNYSKENQKLLERTKKGTLLYACDSYRVFENCVEDNIYGDPEAWALEGGKTVLSPVRAVEEFCWRDTPWGDMTRIVNRTERWDASDSKVYPILHTRYPVLNAAFRMATEIMEKNRQKEYALPGQEGLMNAALFQGEGEGFGSWVRDTCHSAFRCQNLLAPQEARESLVYISEHGFNNGVDCAAMPAIAAWDYYQATADKQILYEMLPGILEYAKEADSRFDDSIGLVHATMCLAQDAFEEPENGGFCLGTEVLFALMYEAAANICEVTDMMPGKRVEWKERSERMKDTIRRLYWNEQKSCFTSGPVGSEAFEKGWWETTGAEMVLWPRFHISTLEQKRKFLNEIKENSEALSDFGINWYPFRQEKNHFWRACWVSWTLGIASAAGEVGDVELLRKLIFGQVRNVMMNKTFHEVIDHDTGRAWRWPHLPWHAAGFIGYIINGVLGIQYDEHGLSMHPAVPKEFDEMILENFRYRNAEYEINIHGSGTECSVYLDGQKITGYFGMEQKGKHRVDVFAS